MFAFVVGCKTSDKKVAGNSGAIKNARDSESVESKKKGKWEWEITPQAEQTEEKKKPAQKEFIYPLKTAETEPSTVGVPEDKKIHEVFKEFQDNKIHLALVVNENGNVIGLFTMEDLLEELFGEIYDEFDDELKEEGTLV